ncbi:hypothetical protein Efla_001819 [Eimeria flavescens]
MGAVSSCCAVEDAEDRQVMKEPLPPKEKAKDPAKSKKESSTKEVKEQKQPEARPSREPKEEKKSKKPQVPASPPPTRVSSEEVSSLRSRLQSGMGITVLLQDGTQLSCTLHLNPADNSLSVSCEDKVRVIPLSDVKSLLSTRDQLKRVETRANLVDDENCVALHLLESGNCIPLRFEQAADKYVFVEMVKQLKAE